MNVHDLFDLVAREKASDLLISAGAPPILRIHGQLFRSRTDALTPEQTKKLIYELLTDEQKAHFEKQKELDFSLAEGRRHRFRVNVYLQRQAVTAALRPIPESIPSLEDLGLPPPVSELAQARQGLILVTGPTGSGKTTTLYAALNELNSLEKNIVTIEDPVEYKFEIINQNQVRDEIGLSFARVLRHILRQDPDIIMVGEIRDAETAEIAVQAALTGHLVLSTMHTNDAASTISRMLEMGVETYLLASALIGVIGQRLVRTVCPDCATAYLPTKAELAKVENFIQNIPEGGDRTYAVRRRRLHESRLFDVQDLLERLESYTFEDL